MNHINNAKIVAETAIGATTWAASKIFNIASTGIATGATYVVPALTYTAKTFVEQLETIPDQDRETLGIAAAAAGTLGISVYIGKKAIESARKKRCIKSVADANIKSASACSSDSTTTTTRTISEVRNNDEGKGGRVGSNELLSKTVDPIVMADENKRKTELIISQLRKELDKKTKECEILKSEAKKRMCDGKTKLQQNKGKQTESRVNLDTEQCRVAQLNFLKKKEKTYSAEATAVTKEVDLETTGIKQCEEEKKIAEAQFLAEKVSHAKKAELKKNQPIAEANRLKEAKKTVEAQTASENPIIATVKELPAAKNAELKSEKLPPAKEAELEKNQLDITEAKRLEHMKKTAEEQSTAGKTVIMGDENLNVDNKDDDISPTQTLMENDDASNSTSVTQDIVLSKNPKETSSVKTNDGSSTIKKSVKTIKSATGKSAFLTAKQAIGAEACRDPRLPADYDYDVSSDSSNDDSDDECIDLTSDDIP